MGSAPSRPGPSSLGRTIPAHLRVPPPRCRVRYAGRQIHRVAGRRRPPRVGGRRPPSPSPRRGHAPPPPPRPGGPRAPHFARTPTNIPEWIFFNLRGGTVTWFLGTLLGTLGAAYLLFWAPDGVYRYNAALIGALLLVLCPWWSGIWARAAARGFVAGFFTVVIPATVYVIAALGWAAPGLHRDPGVWMIDTLMGSLAGSPGLVAPIVLGLLAAVPGMIAGIVGGRIFPTRMRRGEPSEHI